MNSLYDGCYLVRNHLRPFALQSIGSVELPSIVIIQYHGNGIERSKLRVRQPSSCSVSFGRQFGFPRDRLEEVPARFEAGTVVADPAELLGQDQLDNSYHEGDEWKRAAEQPGQQAHYRARIGDDENAYGAEDDIQCENAAQYDSGDQEPIPV